MMNTTEAVEAVRALPRFDSTPISKRAKQRADNQVKEAEITLQHREWLESEYSADLPVTLLPLLHEKAWSDGHHAGYPEVENFYDTHASFAREVIAAAITE